MGDASRSGERVTRYGCSRKALVLFDAMDCRDGVLPDDVSYASYCIAGISMYASYCIAGISMYGVITVMGSWSEQAYMPL